MQRLPNPPPKEDQIDTYIWGFCLALLTYVVQLDFTQSTLEDVFDQALFCEDTPWVPTNPSQVDPISMVPIQAGTTTVAPTYNTLRTPPRIRYLTVEPQQLATQPPQSLMAMFCTRCY